MTNLSDYIKSACDANRLCDTAIWFKESDGNVYHADRHVEPPPEELGPQAACYAGLALLMQWTREAASLGEMELIASRPLLVIDREWLDQQSDAPPPHVIVNLLRTGGVFPQTPLAANRISRDECPIGHLLTGEFEDVAVFEIAASVERGSLGGWLLFFE